ncbi:MAG: RNA-binding protein, partial [bacterium]|nr:RNA-binding protein [bacterium]
MTTHTMKLSGLPFEKITNGRKIVESRLYDEKRRQINIGDQIEFSCNDEPKKKVITKVKALYRYESFKDLFSDFPP